MIFISVTGWLITTAQDPTAYLRFDGKLPTKWDEGLPLGNGMQGALIWQKGDALRFALDRADLWDERPMKGLNRPEFRFEWVRAQLLNKNYKRVQDYFDAPYVQEAGPTKIPGAAMEIVPEGWGEISTAYVDVYKALADLKWKNGVRLQSFVSATEPYGFFRIQGAKKVPAISIVPPAYAGNAADGADALSRLGYKQGDVENYVNGYTYLQEGYDGFKYRVTVAWNVLKGGTIEGGWHIVAGKDPAVVDKKDTLALRAAIKRSFDFQLTQHVGWWTKFWQSKIAVPDKAIERQWHLGQYFFGSTSQKGAPPVSLQGIWTADNGKLPPWKGDFHHDLNTQMSYWAAYSGNHLDEALVLPDYLDARKDNFIRYTKTYFDKEGLNVPGVTTLAGTEMGGWIQYALSPTVSAWLSHHYYWQWRYGMDRNFLRLRAYPWIKQTALFLEQLAVKDAAGKLKLPLSSSPEIYDNSEKAWFTELTNHDLALMKFTWQSAAVMARVLGQEGDAEKWDELNAALPNFALGEDSALKIAPGLAHLESHRHLSHLMAIYPLGLLRYENAEQRSVIQASLKRLDSLGTSQWTGYSFAWQAALKARNKDGAGAAKALHTFSTAFVSPNGFHLNGDQSGKGFSKLTYRPFTLEGNMAASASLQEMLLQSYTDTIQLFPAIPADWKDLKFEGLRTEQGYVVDATMADGKLTYLVVKAEQAGTLKMLIPEGRYFFELKGKEGTRLRRLSLITQKLEKDGQITLKLEVKEK